ncbi:hypothetical protein SLE2022_192280 [Rubroshorea leprosula]
MAHISYKVTHSATQKRFLLFVPLNLTISITCAVFDELDESFSATICPLVTEKDNDAEVNSRHDVSNNENVLSKVDNVVFNNSRGMQINCSSRIDGGSIVDNVIQVESHKEK